MVTVKSAGSFLKEKMVFERKGDMVIFDTCHTFTKSFINIDVWDRMPWYLFWLEAGNVPKSIW